MKGLRTVARKAALLGLVAVVMAMAAVPASAANIVIGGADTGIDVNTLIISGVTLLGAAVLLLVGAGLGFLIVRVVFRGAGKYFTP